ncbi:hypothetical protein [Pseudoclavibacter helvolus]|uniref:hypothetical protein n=1 Tax=Pseudoclavibacter helvolus TaxID=255205 RepID=UPI0012E90C3C|nr:hypothetical protein [Pseudoclavibacter helvolus]
MAFETSTTGQALVDALERDRLDLLAYLQDFQSDGLLMIQDQPADGVNSLRKSVLWRPDADRLIRFVRDPRFE